MYVPSLNLKMYSLLLYKHQINEIPGELSCKKLISSHMKITCYPHM